jgi:hypothetical protein
LARNNYHFINQQAVTVNAKWTFDLAKKDVKATTVGHKITLPGNISNTAIRLNSIRQYLNVSESTLYIRTSRSAVQRVSGAHPANAIGLQS